MPPIRFRCPGCRARIKAPGHLLGQTHGCPRCGNHLVVRPEVPEDSGPLLSLSHDGTSPRPRPRRWRAS
jgi:hypothetical protein